MSIHPDHLYDVERETTQPMILFKWFLNGCQIW